METLPKSQPDKTMAGNTLDRIEALVKLGAEVRLGKRRMHVIHKDKRGMVKIECSAKAWEVYKASGRQAPKNAPVPLR